MAQSNLKQMLFNLMSSFEDQYREKAAMQVILDHCLDSHTRKTWREEVSKLSNDPQLRKKAHAVFERVYAQIDEASDDSVLISLLSQFPIGGKAN